MDRTMLALVAGTAPIDVSTGASACGDAPVDSSPTPEGMLTDALALGVSLGTRSGDSDGQGRVSPNTMEGLASDFSSLSFWRGGRSGRMVARGGLNEDDDVRKLTVEALLASARTAAVVTPRDHLHQVRALVSPLLQPTLCHIGVYASTSCLCAPRSKPASSILGALTLVGALFVLFASSGRPSLLSARELVQLSCPGRRSPGLCYAHRFTIHR